MAWQDYIIIIICLVELNVHGALAKRFSDDTNEEDEHNSFDLMVSEVDETVVKTVFKTITKYDTCTATISGISSCIYSSSNREKRQYLLDSSKSKRPNPRRVYLDSAPSSTNSYNSPYDLSLLEAALLSSNAKSDPWRWLYPQRVPPQKYYPNIMQQNPLSINNYNNRYPSIQDQLFQRQMFSDQLFPSLSSSTNFGQRQSLNHAWSGMMTDPLQALPNRNLYLNPFDSIPLQSDATETIGNTKVPDFKQSDLDGEHKNPTNPEKPFVFNSPAASTANLETLKKYPEESPLMKLSELLQSLRSSAAADPKNDLKKIPVAIVTEPKTQLIRRVVLKSVETLTSTTILTVVNTEVTVGITYSGCIPLDAPKTISCS